MGPGPVRTCIGCRRARPATELVRVARLADGALAIGRQLPGRGAWLCAEQTACCARRAARRRAFERALRTSLPGGAVAALVAELERA